MSDRNPVEWTPLTPEQWAQLPNADHTSLFSREEVAAALRQLAPHEEADEIARELYSGSQEPGTVFFYGDLLSALATLSNSAAERVRSISAGNTSNPEETQLHE
jgi:hypothetical protein